MLTLAAGSALAGTPSAPRDVGVFVAVSETLAVRWTEPTDHGGSDTTSYKIQWRSGTEVYSASRQSVVSATSTYFRDYQSVGYRWYEPTIDGLVDGRRYTVRVIATNADGDGTPSAEASGTPSSIAQQAERLRSYLENTLVPRFESSYPWVREIWDEMQAQNTVVTVSRHGQGHQGSNIAYPSCLRIESATGLPACRSISLAIDQRIQGHNARLYLHEMAHLHTLGNSNADHPGPLAIGLVYVYGMPRPYSGAQCKPEELYADLLMLVTVEAPTARSIYFDSCFGTGPSTVRTEALGVVRSILAGDMPAWLTQTYAADGGGVDRERLWSDIKKLQSSFDRNRSAVVSLLRNSFGGYCDSHRAYDSIVGQGATRDPWRDGGCVPLAPASATVTAGPKELVLSWEAPAGDGGSPIEGYKVQWKSGDEAYASSRQAIVADPGNLAHTIKGLTVGVEYAVQVVPYNTNGDGTASTEATATPVAHPLLSLVVPAATVNGATLVLDYAQPLDEGSEPAASAFTVTVESAARAVSAVEVAGETVTLTLASAVTIGDQVVASYAVPAAAEHRIRSTLGSDAAAFAAREVANDTPPFLPAATVDRATLALDYGAPLDESSEPAASAFTVTVESATRAVNAVVVAGEKATLTLASAVTAGERVTVSYTVPAAARIRSALGTVGAGFAAREVANDTLPLVPTVTVDGATLVLDYGVPLDEESEPAASAFTVTVKSAARAVSTVELAGETVTLTLASAVTADDRVAVSYAVPAAARIRSALGGVAAAFAAREAANNTPAVVTITARHETATVDLDSVLFDLKRNGPTTKRLDVNVQVEQTAEYLSADQLSQTAVFPEGSKSAVLWLHAVWFKTSTTTTNGSLTATPASGPGYVIGDPGAASVRVIALETPFTYWVERSAYRFDENAGSEAAFTVILRTEPGVPAPRSTVPMYLASAEDDPVSAQDEVDYTGFTEFVQIAPSEFVAEDDVFVARRKVAFTIVDDEVEEEAETLNLELRHHSGWFKRGKSVYPDGTTCPVIDGNRVCRIPITIVDDDSASANSAPTGLPAIGGTARVGATLTASVSGIADADGLTGATFAYQWVANDGTADTDIADATESTYAPVAADAGKTVKVRVSFTDDGGTEETLTSAATAAVATANSAPTGLPAIGGTAQVGETLTASVSGIADEDGLTGATFAYQWVANDGAADTNIADATEATYTLAATDTGKTVKVRVSFTDDGGTEETLVSEATETVAVVVPLTARFESVPESHDGTSAFTFELEFSEEVEGLRRRTVREAVLEVTGGTVTRARRLVSPGNREWEIAVEPGSGEDVVVVLPADRACEETGAVCTVDGKRVSNRLEATIAGPASANSAPTGLPVIGGTARVGATLTASVSGIADADGLTGATFAYQWVANDGTADTDIADATESTYAPVAADAGKTVKVRVSFTDDGGAEETLTSAATAAVAAANSAPTGLPAISGTARVGATLTASVSGIADADGLTDATFAYQWVANDGTADTDIADATESTYAPVAADAGKTVKVRVTFTDDGGTEETLVSAATAAVAAANSAPTGLPVIGGTAQVGETLTASVSEIADADGLTGATFAYQWVANDGIADTDIEDATESTYAPVAADAGKTVKVRVSFTDDGGTEETLTSAATAAVAAAATQPSGPLTAFTLVDAGSNTDLLTLRGGTVVALDDYATSSFGIRVETASASQIGSVSLELTGPQSRTQTENWPPYSLYGDASGVLHGAALPAGGYTLRATAYPNLELGGTALQTLEVSFTAVQSASPALPEVSIAAGTSPVTEGTAAAFTLSRSGPTTAALTVTVTVTESGAMLSGTPPSTVSFGPGESGKTMSLPTEGDSVVEAASTVTAVVAAASGYRVAAGHGSAEVSVVDDDVATFGVSANPAEIAEGASSTVTVAITNGVAFAEDQAIALDLSGGTAADADFTIEDGGGRVLSSPYGLTLAAGQSSVTASVMAVDDDEEESAETVAVAARHGASTIGTATVTIAASDASNETAAPEITSAGPFTVDEGETAVAVLTATDDDTVPGDLVWSIPQGDAGGADADKFTVSAAGALSFAGAKDYESPDDAGGDGTYEVTVGVSDGVNAATADLRVMLRNVNEAPTADAGADQTGVSEGAPVTLDGSGSDDPDAGDTLTYLWTQSDETGHTVALSDPAAASPTFTVPSDVTADAVLGFTLRVTDAGGLYAEDTVAVTVTVTVLPAVSIAAGTNPVSEGSAATFTLSRTGPTAAALTVAVNVTESGGMLAEPVPQSVEFPAGDATASLSVPTVNDGEDEADSTVTAEVTTGPGYRVAADAGSAAVTVQDDDEAAEGTVETVWSATLTAKGSYYLGYEKGSRGKLSDTGWSKDGNDYTVTALLFDPNLPGILFELSFPLRDTGGLTLHLGSTALSFADAANIYHRYFSWPSVDPGWRRGAEVSVRLTRETPALAVADAQVQEAANATLDFAVSLSRAASGTVTVDYATSDGSATAGADYTAASGTLTFAVGETSKTVSVPVLDDIHDEGEETLTLTLSNASSGTAITDAEATGTIVNTDPIPKAWLAHFGRTVAGHVVDAIGERLTGPSDGGSHVTLGGQWLSLDGNATSVVGVGETDPEAADGMAVLADRIAAHGDGGAWPRWERDGRSGDGWMQDHAADDSRAVTARELLLGSSFHLALGGDEDAGLGADTRWTAWGRAASSRFDGRDGDLAVDGDVTTFTLGADATWSRWLAGVAVSLSEGEGGFAMDGSCEGERCRGTLESTLTSVHPYARLAVSERLSVWGILGYGTGELTLEEGDPDGAGSMTTRTDTSMQMAAAGARGVLVPAREAGDLELAARTDVTVMRMRSEEATGEAGNLAATEAGTSRLRLVLEGSRSVAVGEGGALTPSLEVGLRHDGGDAETGTGVEIGGGLSYTDPASGLTVDVKVRGLVAHEDADYAEWGASGSVRIDPDASGRGLSLTLAPAWGATTGGAERLWSAHDAQALVANDAFDAETRFDAELGYGFSVLGGRGRRDRARRLVAIRGQRDAAARPAPADDVLGVEPRK